MIIIQTLGIGDMNKLKRKIIFYPYYTPPLDLTIKKQKTTTQLYLRWIWAQQNLVKIRLRSMAIIKDFSNK